MTKGDYTTQRTPLPTVQVQGLVARLNFLGERKGLIEGLREERKVQIKRISPVMIMSA